MAIPPDSSPYGSQTVTGPGWPNVDEEMLAAAAATYEALAAIPAAGCNRSVRLRTGLGPLGTLRGR